MFADHSLKLRARARLALKMRDSIDVSNFERYEAAIDEAAEGSMLPKAPITSINGRMN